MSEVELSEVTLFNMPELAPVRARVTDVVARELSYAVKVIASNYKQYNIYNSYYNGVQPMTYTSEKYRNNFARMVSKYVENMCAPVVDSLSDRLAIVGIEVEGGDADASGEALWKLWEDNYMALQSGEIHTEALRTGDSYVIIWPDDDGGVDFMPQDARNMYVHYPDNSKYIDWAAKWWRRDDKFVRVNLYFKDRIEKYVSVRISQMQTPSEKMQFRLLDEDGVENPVPNPYGVVPVFHFANNTLYKPGRSDLDDVLPIQDALNKSVCDMLVGQEYSAYPQRWMTGVEVTTNPLTNAVEPTFIPGPQHVWWSESEKTQFGQFDGASLAEFVNAHDMHIMSIARVTGTPTHYMLIDPANFPSGESLKTAEARFVAKIVDRQLAFGATWERALAFVAQIMSIPVSTRVKLHWKDASPRSDKDFAETAILKKQFGVSDEQLMREAGYSEDEIKQMVKEKEEQTERSLNASMMALQRGTLPANNGGAQDE